MGKKHLLRTNYGNKSNEEINNLQQQRHILIRTFSRNEITEEDYNNQMSVLMSKIKILNDEIYKIFDEKLKQSEIETEWRRKEMAEEKIKEVKEKKEKKERVPRANSRGSVILEVLQMKTIKDIESAADKVVEKMPGQVLKNVKAQISAIISLVKKQKGKFAKYNWDETTFQLTVK